MGVGASFMQVLCADFDFVKAAVSLSGRQGRMGEIEKHDDWMTWNNPMNRNATEIEKMLNRMHAIPATNTTRTTIQPKPIWKKPIITG